MKKAQLRKNVYALIIPIIVIVAWFLATTYGNIPSGILPGIPRVGETFIRMVRSGQLFHDIGISLSRVVKGYLVSAFLGIILGSLVGMYRPTKEMLIPVITVIRQIPMIAWIPLIILWCGIGETSKVIIIVIAAFFPIMINTQGGFESTPQGYIEVAKLYNLNHWKIFSKVYLPHALPQIFVGLKLGLGVSWMAVVAAELIAATSGIGYRMSDARSLMQSDVVILCMIVIGMIGVIMDKFIGFVFKKLTPWISNENNK